MRDFFARTYDFKGRVSREEFWRAWFRLGFIGVGVALPIILVAVLVRWPAFLEPLGRLDTIVSVVEAPIAIAGLALAFRRLHDRGRSGFWSLAGIPYVVLTPLISGTGVMAWLLFATFFVICIWLAAELFLLPAAKRANRFTALAAEA